MHYAWWNYALLVVASTLRLALAAALRRQARIWPMLLTIIVFDEVSDLANVATQAHYPYYFYTYWIGAGLRSMLSVAVLANAILRIPSIRTIQKSHGRVFITASLSFATLASWYQWGLSEHSSIASIAMSMNACADLAWWIFSLALLVGVGFVGFGWPRRPLRVASGFVVLSATSMASGQILSHRAQSGQMILICSSFIYFAVLFSWVRVFRVPEHQFSLVFPSQSKNHSETSSFA